MQRNARLAADPAARKALSVIGHEESFESSSTPEVTRRLIDRPLAAAAD